jgi:hypothetical protein
MIELPGSGLTVLALSFSIEADGIDRVTSFDVIYSPHVRVGNRYTRWMPYIEQRSAPRISGVKCSLSSCFTFLGLIHMEIFVAATLGWVLRTDGSHGTVEVDVVIIKLSLVPHGIRSTPDGHVRFWVALTAMVNVAVKIRESVRLGSISG